jgi:hypothetical protein
VTSITDRFLVWWLRTGRYQWSRFHRRFFEQKYLSTVLPQTNSPEQIESALNEVQWTPDRPGLLWDCISYPQTTWATRKDDCDGFAILAAELLSKMGNSYQPVLLTALVRSISASHTVCAFRFQNNLSFFDNASLHRESYLSYADIITKITGGGTRLICWDVRDHLTFGLLEFHVV